MIYQTLLKKLFHVNQFGGIKLGLQNALALQELLDFPDRSFSIIHVAGTNGKGSVSTKIASACEYAGYRVGLYTSPHISCFRERIKINGSMIDEKAVTNLLDYLFRICEENKIPATFFELTTFLCFLYFRQMNVDIAVLETGLGGRLDATNVVSPILSIITSISLDHIEILGPSLDAIAKEKGGIIKAKVPVIIGPNLPKDIFFEIAREMNSPIQQVKHQTPLYEEENRSIAKASLDYLSTRFHIDAQAILKGLERKQPCRFERVPGHSPIILDVAHNPDGIKHLIAMLDNDYPNQAIRFLFCLSKNKDLEGCLDLLAKKGRAFHLVETKNGRGCSPIELRERLSQRVQKNRIFLHPSLSQAITEAKEEAQQAGEVLVICGTFFIMSDAREALGFTEPRDNIDMNERSFLGNIQPLQMS